MKKVSIGVNGQKIKGMLIFPPNLKSKNPAVLLIHGWASSETSHIPRAQAIANLGYVCLTFNLRGHGESDGKLDEFSRKDHLQDIIASYDFLAGQLEVDKEKISVCGSSYGGYLATLLSAKRNVKTLVLRGPSLYKDKDFTIPTAEIIKDNPQVFQQTNLNSTNNRALYALSVFKGSVLIIESEKDDIVPAKTIKNYLLAAHSTLLTHKIIKNADHRLSKEEWQREYISLLVKWFNETPK